MTDNGCQHFLAFSKEYGLDSFSLVHAYFSVCIHDEARKRKVICPFTSSIITFNKTGLFFQGPVLPLLQMWWIWATVVFLLTMHLFCLQRTTHHGTLSRHEALYRSRTELWDDLLCTVQGLHLSLGMSANCRKTHKERGQNHE